MSEPTLFLPLPSGLQSASENAEPQPSPRPCPPASLSSSLTPLGAGSSLALSASCSWRGCSYRVGLAWLPSPFTDLCLPPRPPAPAHCRLPPSQECGPTQRPTSGSRPPLRPCRRQKHFNSESCKSSQWTQSPGIGQEPHSGPRCSLPSSQPSSQSCILPAAPVGTRSPGALGGPGASSTALCPQGLQLHFLKDRQGSAQGWKKTFPALVSIGAPRPPLLKLEGEEEAAIPVLSQPCGQLWPAHVQVWGALGPC